MRCSFRGCINTATHANAASIGSARSRPTPSQGRPEQVPVLHVKTAPDGAPSDRLSTQLGSGGAGIRTPVRDKIDHSVYVRIPLIEVSSRWPMESPLLDKPSKFSPATGRRSSRLSRIFDTRKAASGGLLYGQVQQLLRVTQPVRGCYSQLKNIPEVLPGPEYLGTRPQLH